jgi:hypothetical protein
VDIETDSTIKADQEAEKAARIEFLTAAGGFIQQAAQIPVPELQPLLMEMLKFGVSGFKAGRELEAEFKTAMDGIKKKVEQPQQPQGPSSDELQAQAKMQIEQQKMQIEQAKLQAQMQIEQFKAEQAQQIEMMRQQAETERANIKAHIDAGTKLAIAQMTAQAAENNAVITEVEGRDQLDAVWQDVRNMAEQAAGVFSEQQGAVTQAVQMLADAVARMNRPKQRKLVRGPDGRTAGVIELEIEEVDS